MYNQALIDAAMVKYGSPDAAEMKRGAIQLYRHVVPAFFADSIQEQWDRKNNPIRCVPFYIQSEPYEALPIDMPVDPGQVNSVAFDYGTYQFHVIKPAAPVDNPDSGQLACRYEVHGATMTDFVALETVHAGTIMNIIMRLVGSGFGGYQADFTKRLNEMMGIGRNYSSMFS